MPLEFWPLEKLLPYERNARTHSDKQIRQIAANILQFGFINPILADAKAGILAGHARAAAARLLEMAEVSVIVLDHLTEAQKRAYIVADNQIALNADWDRVLLKAELEALDKEEFDLTLIGIAESELRELMAGVRELIDEDGCPTCRCMRRA